MSWGTILKRIRDFLGFNHFKSISSAVAWAFATVAMSFVSAVGVVFVSSVRPNSSVFDLAQRAEYAVAVVLAVFVPLIALLGAAFVLCVATVALFKQLQRLFRGNSYRSAKAQSDAEREAAVISIERKRRAAN